MHEIRGVTQVTILYKKGKQEGTTIWYWKVGGGHFLEINTPILKMLKINNLPSSWKRINNMTFNFTIELGENWLLEKKFPRVSWSPLKDSP